MVKFEFIKPGEMFGCKDGVCLKIEPLVIHCGLYDANPVNCYNVETNKFGYVTNNTEVFCYDDHTKESVVRNTDYTTY